MSNSVAASTSSEHARSRGAHEVTAHREVVQDGPAAQARSALSRVRPEPRRGSIAARVFGVMGVSLGTHMALLGVISFMPAPVVEEHKQVELEIEEPPPPPPPEPPPPAAEEAPQPEPAPAPKPKAAPKLAAPKAATPEPPQAEAKPAAEAPVDLTGVTLTGEDGASWSSVVGNGEAVHGPAARIGRVTGRDRAGSSDGEVGPKRPALVGEASLSRKPVPPDGMDALLEQFFPPRARAQGVSGSALLRVRVLPDGRVGEMQTLRETGDYGFGAACSKALRQKRWQPPLDKQGQPVATEIRYSCEFEVSY